jgi:hypothetical protein
VLNPRPKSLTPILYTRMHLFNAVFIPLIVVVLATTANWLKQSHATYALTLLHFPGLAGLAAVWCSVVRLAHCATLDVACRQVYFRLYKALALVVGPPVKKNRPGGQGSRERGGRERGEKNTTAVSALHALLRLLLVLGTALGAFGSLQGHFMALQEARRSPHGRRYGAVGGWAAWWAAWWAPWYPGRC